MTITERAKRVLASQGRPTIIADRLSPNDVESLGSLCFEDGRLVKGARERFRGWLANYYQSQKAAVEPDWTEEAEEAYHEAASGVQEDE